ncbi:MAG: MBL fold metallo-hydrolase [Actinomycetota bacterium]|nr:MBL fold metallo-hydrolase [Actinomycetota bacterium]
MEPYEVAEETFVIPGGLPVPTIGLLPVNAMIIRGEEPMLLDTLATVQREEFLQKAFSIVEPEDVRWIFISHEDRDHSGSLGVLLERCPNAKIITNFLGLGKLSEEFEIPPERAYFLNDGDTLTLGDRTLTAVRPPLYDSSATRGLFDSKTGVYFSADCFGAVVQDLVQYTDELSAKDFEEGFFWMNRVNHVWFHHIPPAVIEETAIHVRQLNPSQIVSGHGPTARHNPLQMCDWITNIGDMDPVAMPSQDDFERMLAGGPE